MSGNRERGEGASEKDRIGREWVGIVYRGRRGGGGDENRSTHTYRPQ